METTYHYQVIRRALDVIDAAPAQLSLPELAAELEMSPAHFQRVFSQWVGVSPKRYQQYLQLGHAKSLLRDETPTLQTALSLGMSGTGRLHDLFVTWEAMAPGDYAQSGAGLNIAWAEAQTPFGPAIAMATDRGMCAMGFVGDSSAEATRADLSKRWPGARFSHEPSKVQPLVNLAFGGKHTAVHVMGGPFQIKVWEALMDIPEGEATTYSAIAARIGSPKASRAVGTAVGQNPISWLIPCHRVLRKSGELGGYRWGTPVKRAILAWESARAEANSG